MWLLTRLHSCYGAILNLQSQIEWLDIVAILQFFQFSRFFVQAKLQPAVVTQDEFDCYLKEGKQKNVVYHFLSRYPILCRSTQLHLPHYICLPYLACEDETLSLLLIVSIKDLEYCFSSDSKFTMTNVKRNVVVVLEILANRQKIVFNKFVVFYHLSNPLHLVKEDGVLWLGMLLVSYPM